MKILFITDLYPVKNDELTTPRTLFDFVQGFKNLGVSVDVIKPNFLFNSFLRGKKFYKSGQYDEVLNLNYHTPFLFDVTQKINNQILADVIVAHMPSGSIFAYKLACKFDLPLVCGVHISDLEVLTKPLYSIYFKQKLLLAFRRAKLLACRSDVIKKRLIKMYPEFESKAFVAYSGVDEDIIVDRSGEDFNKNKIKVLTCANFKKRKNIDKVIKACKGVESIELTVIGDGKERHRLQKIDQSAKFTGHLSKNQVLEYMRQSDIFILPSVNETFGMVYLEAMASGCITVGVKEDGVDGIIKNGENGYLISPEVADICECLKYIKNSDDISLKVLRKNSYSTIQNFTKKLACEHYLQQIFKIL